jgi:hypothetical protein
VFFLPRACIFLIVILNVSLLIFTCLYYNDLQIVGASKDILELKRDIDVELGHNDSNVRTLPFY